MLGTAEHDRSRVTAEDVAEHAQLESRVGTHQPVLEERRSLGDELDTQRVS